MTTQLHSPEYYLQQERFEKIEDKTVKIVRIPLKIMFGDFVERAPYLYRILANDEVVPFIMNEPQTLLHNAIEEEFARSQELLGKKKCQIILLKGRQMGGTTYTAIRFMDFLLQLNNKKALVTSHTDEDKGFIFEKYEICYKHLPDYLDLLDDDGNVVQAMYPFKPATKESSAKALTFSNFSESEVYVRTAGSGDNIGKGFSAGMYHGCLGENSYVIKADGYAEQIKNIKIGDLVLSGTGNVTEVTNKFDSGVKPTFKIETYMSNEYITASKDHKIHTLDGWKQVQDLTTNDYIKLPKPKIINEITEITYSIPNDSRWYTGKGITSATIKLDEEFGFLVGYYLAEGHCKRQRVGVDKYTSVGFACHKDEYYYKRLLPIVNKLGISTNLETFKNSKRKVFTVYGRFFAELLNHLVGRVEDKHIPEWFFKTNKSFLKGVLIGFAAGDGSKKLSVVNGIYKLNKVDITSSHEKIARQLRRISIALDYGVPSLMVKLNHRYGVVGKIIYHVVFNGDAAKKLRKDLGLELSERKGRKCSSKYRYDGKNYYVKIKNITEGEIEQTYDIEVKDTDHSFETPIGVVSNSETANYSHYGAVLSSVKQTMKTLDFNFVILESTANGTTGIGEGFYQSWVVNSNYWNKFKKGETETFEGYRPVFTPWYMLKTYRKPLINGKLIPIDDIHFDSPEQKRQFEEREKLLMEKYDVPVEAINWYRDTIISDCENKYSNALRYYPTFPEDAFLASNNCFFDTTKLFEVKQDYDANPEKQFYERGTLTEDLEFRPNMYGELQIFDFPHDNWMNRYIVSLDQSEGYSEGDYSSMNVYDRLTNTWVASWHGKMPEDMLAVELMKLGYFYNNALLIPERNRTTVINVIKPEGLIPYEGEIFVESFRGNGEPNWGWFTSGSSRKVMLDEYYANLRDYGYDRLRTIEIVDEHISFVRKTTKTGNMTRYEADTGKKDDIVMSMALTVVAANRWEEELAKISEDGMDLDAVYSAPTNLRRKIAGAKHTRLGRNK